MSPKPDVALEELHALLKLAHGPAVERLSGENPPWIALAYIDEKIAWMLDDEMRTKGTARGAARRAWRSLNEHRRSRALLVGLALSLGADPGPLALGLSLTPAIGSSGSRCGWRILTADMEVAFLPTAYMVPERREIQAPALAAVPVDSPALFLALAVRWRLEQR